MKLLTGPLNQRVTLQQRASGVDALGRVDLRVQGDHDLVDRETRTRIDPVNLGIASAHTFV